MQIIILAGGSGTRLWPLSQQNIPKQFLKFLDNESLFQKTLNRFKNCDLVKDILVITNKNYEKISKKQIQEIAFPKDIKFLFEPDRRNTAPAILLGIKYFKEILNINENEKILILPSDHLISPNEKFLSYLNEINNENIDSIITFGITPTKAATEYGYIKISKQKKSIFFEVEKFVEKPILKKALEFLNSKNYLWNSGIFIFTEKVFNRELQKSNKELYNFYLKSFEECFSNFKDFPNISIDYALLEKTKNIRVCPLEISWSDLGSWDSIYDVLKKDENFNVFKGNVKFINTKNSLIFGGKKLITTSGVEDIIFIETDDAIFISKRGLS